MPPNISFLKSDSKMKQKFIFFTVFSFYFLFYALYVLYACINTPMDSDFANMILAADDIIKGNILMNDWHQTGISFLTTDMLFFICGVLLFGISEHAFTFALFSMFIVLSLCVRFLISAPKMSDGGHSYNFFQEILFLAVFGIPATFALTAARSHIGGIFWITASFYFVFKLYNKDFLFKSFKKKSIVTYLLLLIICLTIACFGDSIYLVVGVLPIVFYSFFCLLYLHFSEKKDILKNLSVLFASAFSVLMTFILHKIYYIFSTAESHIFLFSYIAFQPAEKILENLFLYVTILLKLNNAYFLKSKVFEPLTIFYILNSIFVVAGICISFVYICRFIKYEKNKKVKNYKKPDVLCVLLSLSFFFISFVLISTNMLLDTASARYVSYMPAFFCVIIARYFTVEHKINFNIYGFISALKGNKESLKKVLICISEKVRIVHIFSFLFCILLIFGCMYQTIQYNQHEFPSQTKQKNLSHFLIDKNLSSGYANFWDASSVTVYSENQIKVRAVNQSNLNINMYKWFCKNEWYDSPAHFIIYKKSNIALNSEEIQLTLGKPDSILEYGEYSVHIYNHDISKSLIK